MRFAMVQEKLRAVIAILLSLRFQLFGILQAVTAISWRVVLLASASDFGDRMSLIEHEFIPTSPEDYRSSLLQISLIEVLLQTIYI